MVSEVSNEHITYIFKCQAIQEELTLCSSETYDITSPETVSHPIRPESIPWFCLEYVLGYNSSASLSVPKQ